MKTVYYLTGDDVYKADSLDRIIKIAENLGLKRLIKALGENWEWKKSTIWKGKEYIIIGHKYKVQWTLNRITE